MKIRERGVHRGISLSTPFTRIRDSVERYYALDHEGLPLFQLSTSFSASAGDLRSAQSPELRNLLHQHELGQIFTHTLVINVVGRDAWNLMLYASLTCSPKESRADSCQLEHGPRSPPFAVQLLSHVHH
jgi:hypothetical protein